MTTHASFNDIPRDIIVEMLFKAHQAIYTGKGTIYKKEIDVNKDGKITTFIIYMCGLCGRCARNDACVGCQKPCEVCMKQDCKEEMMDARRFGDQFSSQNENICKYLHKACMDPSKHFPCEFSFIYGSYGLITCGLPTDQRCEHSIPVCGYCSRDFGCRHS